MVLDSEGTFTKHYFAGEQRVGSRLKEGGGTFYQRPAAPRSTGTEPGTKEWRPDVEADFKTYLEKAGFKNAEVQKEFAKSASFEYGVYYLHGDHLGTATMVTNWDGTPTQFFLNLPFGETRRRRVRRFR